MHGRHTTVHFLASDGAYCTHHFDFKVVRPHIDILLKEDGNVDLNAEMTGLSLFDSLLTLSNSSGSLNAAPYIKIPRGIVVQVPERSLRWSAWESKSQCYRIGLLLGKEQHASEYLSACLKVIDTGEFTTTILDNTQLAGARWMT